MHLQTGHLNYLSNSNLDYNNPLNVRRVGAFAGVAHQNMSGIAMQANPKHHMAGLAINEMGGLAVNNMGGLVETAQEQVMDKPLLWTGIALMAYPKAHNSFSKKKLSKKAEKQVLYAGLGAIAFHFIMPMFNGE